MMQDLATIRDRLAAQLERLEAQVRHLEASQREPLDDDWSDQAIERADDEALDAVERAALREIGETRRAIRRLDAGHYGTCTGCGAPIDAKRLEALPTATHCVACVQDFGEPPDASR